MNPLKLRLPLPAPIDPDDPTPTPADVRTWLTTLPAHDAAASLLQAMSLLQRLNRRTLPTTRRFETLQSLRPWLLQRLPELQKRYRNKSLPLTKSLQRQADEVFQLLDELAQGYKLLINDAISNLDHDDMKPDTFLLALRQAIEQLGQLLQECYAQYRSEPAGSWGELHRLYALAERNGLNTMAIDGEDSTGQPLTNIQHTYLRIAMLGLAQPSRLLPGQADTLYVQLKKWTAGCRMFEKRATLAEAGDIVIDLAGDRPPQMATSQTRFRPVMGRFLNIDALRQRLEKLSQQVNERGQLSLTERMRRDLLFRLCQVWQGRGERQSERIRPDSDKAAILCVGLGAAHHNISGGGAFTPEADESNFHRPGKGDGNTLSLMPRDSSTSLRFDISAQTRDGRETTRVSRFDTDGDVWNAVHDTQHHARVLREAAAAGFATEPWRVINISDGGVALLRQPDSLLRARVGVLTAYHREDQPNLWHVGIVRWLQTNEQDQLALGIKSLGTHMVPIAVRAIAGTGNGGEYFRSLLIDIDEAGVEARKGLLVPVGIYDIGTQLVLNLKPSIKYAVLTHLIETTSAFSLFAFNVIDTPPHEKARIQMLPEKGE